jgi:hypothetical protein
VRPALPALAENQTWAPITLIDVTVQKWFLQLPGRLRDERQRKALRILAKNVPGVKIENQLVWVHVPGSAPQGDDSIQNAPSKM